jgi:hypothetical protein
MIRFAKKSLATAIVVAGVALLGQPAFAADVPTFGADGSGPLANGGPGTYTVPNCSAAPRYDQYFGEVGYATSGGGSVYEAPGTTYNSNSGINEANDNYNRGHGAGAGAFFFMAGPGWASGGGATTMAEAIAWGAQQASDVTNDFNSAQVATGYKYKWLFLTGDIEGGIGHFGWVTNTALNWYVWEGFRDALQGAGTNVAVYSSPALWNQIMLNRSITQAEWTSENNYGPVTPCPTSVFTGGPGGYSAAFFANMASTSNSAIAWQWSTRGGDYDQIDLTHYNNLFGTSLDP